MPAVTCLQTSLLLIYFDIPNTSSKHIYSTQSKGLNGTKLLTAQLNNLTNPNIRFNSLDGIRGILALTVLFSHTIGVATGWTEQRPLVGAYISVIYFFMMSGFVLTHAHRVSHKFLPYLLFRLARLWPLHVISIILMIVIYTYNKHVGGYIPGLYFLNWKVILENIAFLHGITPLDFPLINEPSWSISIEFWASLLVPIIFIRIPLLKRLFFSVSILLFLCLKSKTGFSSSEFNGMFPFLLALCCMMLGSTVYAFASSKWLKPIIEKNFFEIFLWVCFAFCLIGIYEVVPSVRTVLRA